MRAPSSAIGSQRVSRCSWLEHDIAAARQAADERQNADEAPGQDLEQIVAQRRADLDREAGLLLHFALQRGAMVLAGIGPAAGQIPFTALVQQQKHAALMDQDAFDGDGSGRHRSISITVIPERSEGPLSCCDLHKAPRFARG